MLFSSSCCERSLHEKTFAFQIGHKIYRPFIHWFTGHGTAGDVGVPWPRCPRSRGAEAGARRETGHSRECPRASLPLIFIYIFFTETDSFIAIIEQRKINEKRGNDTFKQYNTSVSGLLVYSFFLWGGGARRSG